MKKYMTDIAVILLVFSLMVGCSDKNTQNESNTESPASIDNQAGENVGNSIYFPENDNTISSAESDGKTNSDGQTGNDSTNSQNLVGQGDATQNNSNQNNDSGNSAAGVYSKISEYNPLSIELKKKDTAADYNASECTRIVFSDSEAAISGNGAEYSEIDENGSKCRTVTINSAGDYLLSGSCANGRIIISADKKDDVRLILDGIDISSSTMAAIIAENCDKLIITLADNSMNYLRDKSPKTEKTDEEEEAAVTDSESEESEEDYLTSGTNAAIYSKSTITINGSGQLTINSDNVKGIYSKDDVRLVSGNISINSGAAGIKCKDGVIIAGADVNISSLGDAVKASSDKENKGYFVINSGSLTVNSEKDGISVNGDVNILAGKIDISCSGGEAKSLQEGFGRNPWQGAGSSDDSSAVSSKGIKSKGVIYIENGDISINTNDDSIHADNAVLIAGGTITVSSGDDGIHADNSVIIDNGTIKINKSYEGIEAEKITINGGDIMVYSNDDGINASAASNSEANGFNNLPGANFDFKNFNADNTDMNALDFGNINPSDFEPKNFDPNFDPNSVDPGNLTPGEFAMDRFWQGRPDISEDETAASSDSESTKTGAGRKPGNMGGGFGFGASSNAVISITGGNIYINANGDGVDSNGALYISGGLVLVDGPTENMNSAVDHDGTAIISGGVLVASGSSGMIENFEEESTQNVLMVYFDKNYEAGTEINLMHGDELLLGFKNAKSSACVMISSPKLITGESYTVTANGDTVCELTINSTITSNSSNAGFGGFGGGHGNFDSGSFGGREKKNRGNADK